MSCCCSLVFRFAANANSAAVVFVSFLCFFLFRFCFLFFPALRPRRPPGDDPAHPQRASDRPRQRTLKLQGRGLEGRVEQGFAGRAARRRVRDLEQRRRRKRVSRRFRSSPSASSLPDPGEPDADGVRAPRRRARDGIGGSRLQKGREGCPAELRGRLAVRGLFFFFFFFFFFFSVGKR